MLTAAASSMQRCRVDSVVGLVLVALSAVGLQADDWTTVGLDAQRSSWVRSDIKISDASVRSGEFQHLWRREMPSAADEVESLTGPVLLDFLISHRGFRSLAFASSRSGGVFAMDTDLARMEWVRRLGAPVKAGSGDCPGGLAANLSRPTATAMPSSIGFAARGRRTPAKSGVGAPGEGAVTLVREAPATPSTPRPTGTARTRPPAQRALRGVTLVHAISAAGNFHTLYVSNGRDHVPPDPVLGRRCRGPWADRRGWDGVRCDPQRVRWCRGRCVGPRSRSALSDVVEVPVAVPSLA